MLKEYQKYIREVYFAYDNVVGESFNKICCNYDDDAFILAQAARIVRKRKT